MRLGLGIKASLATIGLLVLSACKDDKAPDPPPPPAAYTIGGSLSGLNGSVTLANNGGDSRTLTANGAFTFAAAATTGTAYSVTVTAQPTSQTCTVTSGAGSVAASNVSSVAVACVTNTYSVGGTLSGLVGSVTLANNGGDSRTLTANGAFTFATAAPSGTAYNVTVSSQPTNQTCTVTSGTGSVAANVAGIAVSCATNSFTVGGTVTGLAGSDLVLRNNGANDLTRSADGAFTFTTPVVTGGAYAVTIATPPANQTCTLTNATGTIAAANVSNVAVACTTFRITGVFGPAGGTLIGPDNVEVVIPAGALTQSTTIGVARSPGGWPTPLVENATPIGSIYELTPHDVIFNKPVLIRMPAPSGMTDPASFVSSFNEGWQYTEMMLNGNYAEMERNVFSWVYLLGADCAPNGLDPYPCDWPRGHSFATATPAGAISMLSGVLYINSNGFSTGSAGTWMIDSNLLTALQLTMEYDAAPDCLFNSHLQLKRLVRGATPPAQLISDQSVTMDLEGNGRATVSINAQDLDQGISAYLVRFGCTRPGRNEMAGGDWITVNVSPNPVPGFTVGGSISGLAASGLELQNWTREIVSVPSGSTTFAFGTPLNTGASYNVRVRQQPVGHLCSVANASGQVAAAAVSNIAVTCHSTAPVVQKLVLVANIANDNLTIFRRNTDSGRLIAEGTVNTGDYPFAVAVTPDGRFAYVANAAGNSVSSFSINGMTLAPIAGASATNNPFGLAVDPQGQYLRVANYSTHTVSSFSINGTTGALTSLGSNPVGLYPYAVVTHPNGNFVYVISEVGSSSTGPSVSGFSVNPSSGALTSLGQPTAAPVSSPHDLAITPDGAFMYGVSASGRVGRLNINSTTGALTTGPSTTINFSSGAESLAIHPNGAFLYVTASSSPGAFVQVFSIGSTGALTAVAQVPTGAGSNKVAIDGGGDFLYVTNSTANTVTSYSINSISGDLTLLETDPTGVNPHGIALTP